MNLGRLNYGEKIMGASAVLLFAFMFFHWYGVEFSNSHSSLLNYIRIAAPGKSAWEALDYIPIVLLVAIMVALAVPVSRVTNGAHRHSAPVNAVAALGIFSVLLILFRIIEPPHFDSSGGLTAEVTIQFPIFLALLAAAGIVFGGCLAMREERITLSGLRAGRHRDQVQLHP
jgi:hypothetical protein